jgi:hypothetical protein
MIVHNVFFKLKDASSETIATLIADSHSFISEIPDIRFYAVSQRLEEMQRPANDQDFHVNLCVVLESREALDVYAFHPAHKSYIEKHKDNWETLRVFDSVTE